MFASYFPNHLTFTCRQTLDLYLLLASRDVLIRFLFFPHFKRYTRNLVDAGNGRFNLMILCWNEGQSSTIHDHADSHCFMKVLKGGLTEIKYCWPQPENDVISDCEPKCIGNYQNTEEENELQEISRTTITTNDVCYINGNFKRFFFAQIH